MMTYLQKIFSNPAESLSIFTRDEIDELEEPIYERDGKLYLHELLKKYKYSYKGIKVN